MSFIHSCAQCGREIFCGCESNPTLTSGDSVLGNERACACGKVEKRTTDHKTIRRIKASVDKEARAYIDELESLWDYANRKADRWRGIASAMGYEPNAHNAVKPTEPWLLERIAKFRAVLTQPVDTNEAPLLDELLRRIIEISEREDMSAVARVATIHSIARKAIPSVEGTAK